MPKIDLDNNNIGVLVTPAIYDTVTTKVAKLSAATGNKVSYSQVTLDMITKYIKDHPNANTSFPLPSDHRTKQLNLVPSDAETKKSLLEKAQANGRTLSDYCFRILLLALK